MGASTVIVLDWADGQYTFKLAGKQIEELQRLCGSGPTEPIGIGTIANRVFNQQFFWADVYHTIRLALIGGGMPPVRAQQLVDTYIDGKALGDPNDPSSPLRTTQAIYEDLFFDLGNLPRSKSDEGEPTVAAAQGGAMSTSRPSEHKLSS